MKNNKLIGLLIFNLLFASCNNLPAFKKINPLIKELSILYNTSVEYEVGVQIVEKRKYNFIKVRVKESDIIKNYPDKHIPASYISVFLAKKVDYGEYRIEFYNDKGVVSSIIYYNCDIERILEKMNYFDEINQIFLQQDYGKIYDLAHEEVKGNMSKEAFVKLILENDKKYGKVTKIITHGYRTIDRIHLKNNKFPVVGYYAIFRRKKGDIRTSIFINETNNKIISIKFDW